MAIHGLREPLGRGDLHDWGRYRTGLDETPFLRETLADRLQSWVECEAIANPLQIDWVWTLYAEAADFLEDVLTEWSGWVGEGNLRQALAELPHAGRADEIGKKIASLAEELQVCKQMRRWGMDPTRCKKGHADWEAGGRIVSVKAPLNMDFNNQILDAAVLGAFSVVENSLLRERVNHVRIEERSNLGDRFRAALIAFFDNGLCEILEAIYARAASSDWTDLAWDDEWSGHDGSSLMLKMEARGVDTGVLELLLSEAGAGTGGGSLQLTLQRDSSSDGMLVVHFPEDTWWGSPSPFNEGLHRKIADDADKLQQDYEKLSVGDSFLGWLNVEVHPQHQFYVARNRDGVKEWLQNCVGPRPFEVVVCLHGGFELRLPQIIRIPPTGRR